MREKYSFLPMVKELTDLGIPVLVANYTNDVSEDKGVKYPGEALAEQNGAIIARSLSPLVASTKFRWLVYRVNHAITAGIRPESNRIKGIKELMGKPMLVNWF